MNTVTKNSPQPPRPIVIDPASICPKCRAPWLNRNYCPNDGTLRHNNVEIGERYQLEHPLGVGGMGIVFSARHRLLGKRVAVKLLRTELSRDANQVARFMREAQLCGQLKHDNIVNITDFGRDQNGELYIVTEFLHGETLAQLLTRDVRLKEARAIPILRQLCRALSCAHEEGIVHRDLTPRNIFLTDSSGRQDIVKLLDFGISRLATGDDRITATGVAVGTTRYMPPEQLRGSQDQDHRVDIYALGVIAYEMLAGCSPFSASAPAQLIVEKLSPDTAQRLKASLPDSELGRRMPAIVQLILECLDPDPARRPASTVEVEQRLLASGIPGAGQADDLSGLRAGSYRLTTLLGSGGLGSVWLGEHPVIGAKVAVKVLHPQMCESVEAVRRFVTEAQSVNRVNHPHIVKIFDFGKMPDGRDYAVMEYLEGETLGAYIARQGRLPIPQAAQIVYQIASALEVAHKAGVIHRDLKPDNIYLLKDGQIKVLDFGIAKLLDDDAHTTQQTKMGFGIGTPLYAAPEQAAGKVVNTGADIYSLGIVWYEMLTGQTPFAGNVNEVLTAKMTTAVPSIKSKLYALHPELVTLIDAMVLNTPEQRPGASEVLSVLTPLMHASSPNVYFDNATTAPGMIESGLKEKPRSRRGLIITIAVACLLLGLAVIGYHYQSAKGVRTISQKQTPLLPQQAMPSKVITTAPPQPSSTLIQLNTQPAGADVILDGQRIGITPLRIKLPADTPELTATVKRTGYIDTTVILGKNTASTLTITLKPAHTDPLSPRRQKRSASPTRKPKVVNPFDE